MSIPCAKKEGFNGQDLECVYCPENILCIPNSHATIKCSLKNRTKCLVGSSDRNICVNDHCERILELMQHKQKFICGNFGTPKREPIKHCLNCHEETFKQCEIMEALLQNQMDFTLDDAEESINNLELELSTETNSCFRKYINQEVCIDECEFIYRCMRETGITGRNDCKFFPMEKDELFNSDQCKACICKDGCLNILTAEENKMVEEAILKEEEKKSFFHNVRNLRSIYDEFTNEEN